MVDKAKDDNKKEPDKVNQLHDFSRYMERYKAEVYESSGSKLFRIDTQLRILNEYCADMDLQPAWQSPSFDISPLAHTVAITLTFYTIDTDSKQTIHSQFPGISCVYHVNHEELAKHGPAERALTSAMGKAMAYAGIRFGGATRGAEEQENWERANTSDISPKVSNIAQKLSRLSEVVRYEAKKQGLDIIRMARVLPEDISIEELGNKIEDKSLLKEISADTK